MIRDKVYISHIIECIEYINSYVKDGKKSFEDHKTYDAVLRQLQIMSESSKRLSNNIKEKHTNISWREIAGFRNILVHDYMGDIDCQIIWSVVINKLPELKAAMQEELKNIE